MSQRPIIAASDLQGRLAIAGGDIAMELARRGWSANRAAHFAAIEKPDVLRDVADSLVDAGVEILITPTSAANALAIQNDRKLNADLTPHIRELNLAAASVLRAAADRAPQPARYVLGAIGPAPQLLMLQEVQEQDCLIAFGAQAELLNEGGVDAICLQGFTDLRALELAIQATVSATELPIVATMAFDCGLDGTETTLGVSIPQLCSALLSSNADSPTTSRRMLAIGCDGGEGVDFATAQLALFRKACDLPIWISLSPGYPQIIDGLVQYSETPAEFSERAIRLAEAGANVLSGGRGVSVEHLGALMRTTSKLKKGPGRKQAT